MKKILDYNILQKRDETRNSITYLCYKEDQNNRFIIKELKTTNPSQSDIARFRQEYDIIKNADVPGIVKIYDIISYKNGFVLIQEDFEGIPLDKILNTEKITIIEFLQIAIKLAEILGNLHKNDIIHKNIKPHSILFNKETFNIKITDFGISSLLYNKNEDLYNIDLIENTLAYTSPEQTGRMNRSVDYRTDMYSLGITFYQILTGEVPFLSMDPMKMIYSHIARNPSSPIEKNPHIPKMISDIVMRLLSKTVEDRYQNSFGLMADLQECLDRFSDFGKIEPFNIGNKDVPIKYVEPQGIIGRDKEIDILISTFERVCAPSLSSFSKKKKNVSDIMLVSGPPGIGKTALINEIRKPIVAKRGYFTSGKYDQLSKDTPYSSIVQAFQGLVRQILSESEERIKAWEKKLSEALNPVGKVITDIIPEVELIIGRQPELAQLGSEKATNRLNFVFEKFVSVFATEEHPIVLFLDDLQWADHASLQLMRNMIINPDISFIFLIGAYRDNEVPDTHPLVKMQKEIEKSGIKVNRLSLSPLMKTDVCDLVIDFLKCTDDRGFPISELVFKKTGGNPFFINQFLRILYNEKLLELDAVKGWQWDIDKINQMQVTDNVIELMIRKINKLHENTREALKICAGIGSRFDLETLSSVLEKSVEESLLDLTEAINEGLVGISDDDYIFQHDRIEEAAYSLIPEKERAALHYRIGKIALDKYNEDSQSRLFFIVDQLNLGSELINNVKDREELAKLNLKAGKKAKASAAYSPAFEYLNIGIGLLGKECWEKQYNLTLDFYTEATETACFIGDFSQMNKLAEPAINNARSAMDKARIYQAKIHSYTAREDFHGALSVSLFVLRLLGVRISLKQNKVSILFKLIRVKWLLLGKTVEDLINHSEMSDPVRLMTARIVPSMGSASYYVNPNVFAAIILHEVVDAIKYGNSPEHAAGYIAYGLIILSAFQDINGSYKFGQLGLRLADKMKTTPQKGKLIFIYNVFIRHWKEHVRESILPLLEGYQRGLEMGEVEFAAYNLFFHDRYSFFIGKKLTEMERDIAKHYQDIAKLNQDHILGKYTVMWQEVLNLLGQNDDPAELTGTVLDQEKMLPLLLESNIQNTLAGFYFSRLILRYLFYKYSKALEDADEIKQYLHSIKGLYHNRYITIFDTLIKLALYGEVTKRQKKIFINEVRKNKKKIKKWVDHAPMNNLHFLYLIEAELARVLGKNSMAEKYYDMAVETSKKYEFISVEALANELAAKFYISCEKKKIAGVYLADAYNCYSIWEAKAKLKHLNESYPELLSLENHKLFNAKETTNSIENSSEILDNITIMKATQAISGEIVMEKLLSKLIKILMENSGAEKVVMLFKKNDNFYIEAESRAEQEEVMVFQSIPIEEKNIVPELIVRFVARTGETVVLDDASNEQIFCKDKYILKRKPKSILCIPVIYQDKITAILYLENNFSKGIFTREQQEILKILATQAAISLENALLYDTLLKEISLRKKIEDERIQLEKEILEVSEEERRNIGMELHDGLGHDLLEISMKVGMLADKLSEKSLPEISDAADIEKRIINAIKKNRSLAKGLSPINLENTNFIEIIGEFINELKNNYNIKCTTEIDKSIMNKNIIVSTHLYYIIQEAIRNIASHSKAQNAKISIICKNNIITLIFKDDGIGISKKSNVEGGMGLNIMYYRARMIGASLDISDDNDCGTEVKCSFSINS